MWCHWAEKWSEKATIMDKPLGVIEHNEQTTQCDTSRTRLTGHPLSQNLSVLRAQLPVPKSRNASIILELVQIKKFWILNLVCMFSWWNMVLVQFDKWFCTRSAENSVTTIGIVLLKKKKLSCLKNKFVLPLIQQTVLRGVLEKQIFDGLPDEL